MITSGRRSTRRSLRENSWGRGRLTTQRAIRFGILGIVPGTKSVVFPQVALRARSNCTPIELQFFRQVSMLHFLASSSIGASGRSALRVGHGDLFPDRERLVAAATKRYYALAHATKLARIANANCVDLVKRNQCSARE